MEILVDVDLLKMIAIMLGINSGFSITAVLLLLYLIFKHPQCCLSHKPPEPSMKTHSSSSMPLIEGKLKAFSPAEIERG